jgi:transposase
MARPFKGRESLREAQELLRTASTVEQLRQAQAVVLPLCYGLSLEQTAEIIGVSPSWASRLRNTFLSGKPLDTRGASVRGGRRRESFSPEREAELLAPFLEPAKAGGILVVGPIKQALEAALGRELALSTVYNVLHRHGWRKLAPDKRHPQSDPAAQEEFKKNSPRSSRPSKSSGPKARQSG